MTIAVSDEALHPTRGMGLPEFDLTNFVQKQKRENRMTDLMNHDADK